jgi:probable rRNA maturation factor
MNDPPSPGPTSRLSEDAGLSVLTSNRQDLPVDEPALAALAEMTLRAEGLVSGELSLSFVGEEEMEALHQRYLGEPGPTDVLSFPMAEDGLLGDIVICPTEARRNKADVASELRLLVVHGVLHLVGYDHQEEDERRVMWAKQDAYLVGPRRTSAQ